ncbi:MAG: hypothetical protein CXT71_03610 [Methanobacteriota archaeon]|nr:MAG: hypothetical protein CXT71_03610 [Euryarchaeota archaeon]
MVPSKAFQYSPNAFLASTFAACERSVELKPSSAFKNTNTVLGISLLCHFPPSGWNNSLIFSWVASIISGEVIERLNTLTGKIWLTNSCALGSWVPATNSNCWRGQFFGTIDICSNW